MALSTSSREPSPAASTVLVWGNSAPDAALLATLVALRQRGCLLLWALDTDSPETLQAQTLKLPPSVLAKPSTLVDWLIDSDTAVAASLLLINVRVFLGEQLLTRLIDSVETCAEARVVSPLSDLHPALSPLPEGVVMEPAPGPQTLQRVLDQLAEGELLDASDCLPHCSAWSAAALRAEKPSAELALGRTRMLVRGDCWVSSGATSLRGPDPASDARYPMPCQALDRLRIRIREALELELDPAAPATVQSAAPVILHLLHGWGGGSERWVCDMAAADGSNRHLLLRAGGHHSRRQTGEVLELIDAASGVCIDRFPLTPAIVSSRVQHAGYAAVLDQVSQRWSVRAVIVSSMIGHSLDIFRLGLPTLVMVHDYYPLWPLLGVDPGRREQAFDEQRLRTDLHAAGSGFEFAETDSAFWLSLRAAYVDALLSARATLITPTQCVMDNLLHLAPELSPAPRAVIGHGIETLPALQAAPPRIKPGDKLRLLLVGRIRADKGAKLLARCLPELLEHAEILLLGAGREAEQFFAVSGIHIIMDYRVEELPTLVDNFRPHAALMLPTLAETFSYTLSELWSLGLPVLATRLGALAERITHDHDGVLFEAEPSAVIAAVAGLLAQPERLDALRQNVAARDARNRQTMLAEHLVLLPDLQASRAEQQLPMYPQDAWRADAACKLQRLQQHNNRLAAQLTQQRSELDSRAEWAREQEALASERLIWARSLKGQVDHERANFNTVQQRSEMLDTSLQQTTARLAHTRALTQRMQAEANESQRILREISSDRARLQAVEQRLQQTLGDVTHERDTMLSSRSWRMTQPLRDGATRLRFRRDQLRSLWRRVVMSLRSRGLRSTLARIPDYFKRSPVTAATPALPDLTREFEPFALPTSLTPQVSVIIPIYNKFEYTHACLRSIAEHGAARGFEVIVVDDCGSDGSASLLAQIEGLRYHRNEHNLGFVGACNAGAAMAIGSQLLFLNNDTVVTPGWLDALSETLESWPQAGLVGSMLVYPDGRLQEAGGIVFADGSGWNYGRFGDPDDPAFAYPREVDYCSGASILIKRALFEQLGGFDSRYSPAYYEDTDLAFAVRDAGLKVIYQPRSRIIHFEGVTSGTDTASGIKRYQVVNQAKFVEHRAAALARQPIPGTAIELAREHRVRGRMLIIDACTPTPDQDSGSLRMINLMRLLTEDGWKVVFFADNRTWMDGYTQAVAALGVEILYHPWLADPVGWIRDNGRHFNAVLLSRHYIASNYVALVREFAPQAQLLFDTVDLHYLREQRAAELEDSDTLRREAARTRDAELKLIDACDITLVVSHVEKTVLAGDAPSARVEILSNVHQIYGCRRDFEQRADLVFVGGFQHVPNVDAAQWFCREILPRVRAALPEVKFHLIGSKAPAEIRALESEGMVFHGYVEDIEPFMDNCRISVAPLRWGAGVKGKVNMAMSYGLPVVATTPAIEGMHVHSGSDVLVADTPEDFANEIIRLYQDPELWQQLSQSGLQNVSEHFSFAAAQKALRGLLA